MYKAEERIVYLSKLAENKKDLKFKDLYQNLCRAEFLEYAYRTIKANKGTKTAGVDGITKADLGPQESRFKKLDNLANAIRTDTYTPLPVRRVEIPKKNSSKTRPLGIPALYDRIVQAGIKIILEAIYESNFCDTSHGFRPKRSCQTAINEIVMKKYDWVIEGDIQGCFDNINHGILLNLLRKRIADEKFINIINKFLKSGYQLGFDKKGKLPIYQTKDGTPQGGIVSPILANIYLHEFDKFMQEKIRQPKHSNKMISSEYMFYENRIRALEKALKKGEFPVKRGYFKEVEGRKQKVRVTEEFDTREMVVAEILRCKKARKKVIRIDKNEWYSNEDLKGLHYVRYADDFIIILNRYDKATAIAFKDEITKWFQEKLKLVVHQEKTTITHSTKNVTFLGYDFNLTPNSTGYGYKGNFINIYVPKVKRDNLLENIDKILRCNYNLHPYDVFNMLNSVINGFGMYYQICNNWSTISGYLNNLIFWKVLHWMGHKYKCTIPTIMEKYYRFIPKLNRKGLIVNSGEKSGCKRALVFLNDIKYTPVHFIAMQIQNGCEMETWFFTDKQDTKSLQKAYDNGYSEAQNLEDLAENNYQCIICGSKKNLEIHHVKMVRWKRRNNRKAVLEASKNINRVVLCEECHKKETRIQVRSAK